MPIIRYASPPDCSGAGSVGYLGNAGWPADAGPYVLFLTVPSRSCLATFRQASRLTSTHHRTTTISTAFSVIWRTHCGYSCAHINPTRRISLAGRFLRTSRVPQDPEASPSSASYEDPGCPSRSPYPLPSLTRLPTPTRKLMLWKSFVDRSTRPIFSHPVSLARSMEVPPYRAQRTGRNSATPRLVLEPLPELISHIHFPLSRLAVCAHCVPPFLLVKNLTHTRGYVLDRPPPQRWGVPNPSRWHGMDAALRQVCTARTTRTFPFEEAAEGASRPSLVFNLALALRSRCMQKKVSPIAPRRCSNKSTSRNSFRTHPLARDKLLTLHASGTPSVMIHRPCGRVDVFRDEQSTGSMLSGSIQAQHTATPPPRLRRGCRQHHGCKSVACSSGLRQSRPAKPLASSVITPLSTESSLIPQHPSTRTFSCASLHGTGSVPPPFVEPADPRGPLDHPPSHHPSPEIRTRTKNPRRWDRPAFELVLRGITATAPSSLFARTRSAGGKDKDKDGGDGGFYTAHGPSALYVERHVLHTNSVLKYLGAGGRAAGLPSANLSASIAKTFWRDALTIKQPKAEIWVLKLGQGRKAKKFLLDEDALIPTGTTLGTTDRDFDLKKLKNVLDRCGVVFTERKPSEFTLEEDLTRLLTLSTTASPSTIPQLSLPTSAPDTLAALLAYLSLFGDPSNHGAWVIRMHDLDQHMRLDSSALRVLNLVEVRELILVEPQPHVGCEMSQHCAPIFFDTLITAPSSTPYTTLNNAFAASSNLTLSRTTRAIVELHHKLRDLHSRVTLSQIPIQTSIVQPAKRNSVSSIPCPALASPASKSVNGCHMSRASTTTNANAPSLVSTPVTSPRNKIADP
ncbi:hypothetical protein EW146_g10072 [Bondarzewia mesenterica]|uniref:Uncharacterized protein n=1 Tax=Bondarzewia mesenterica TaxID=1095465 RepID=A0A4S4L0W0_9AGAM|nr:hypothetical protein EW146_g10072 [Bondarzewia mesenterica]